MMNKKLVIYIVGVALIAFPIIYLGLIWLGAGVIYGMLAASVVNALGFYTVNRWGV